MKEVTIPLRDLKRLINDRLERDANERAQIIVVTRPGNSDASGAIEYAGLVHEAKPAARKWTLLRYQQLLGALDREEGIAEALASFLG